jgi:hypothetical protein
LVYDQPDAVSVHAQSARVLDALEGKLPQVAAHLRAARADILAFTAFPKAIRLRHAPSAGRSAHHIAGRDCDQFAADFRPGGIRIGLPQPPVPAIAAPSESSPPNFPARRY